MDSGVYTITNRDTGKVYVGSAVDFARRWQKHRRELDSGTHHNKILQRAWVKYGSDAFEFKKIIVCARKDALLYEQRAIDVLAPQYNICRVAGSVLGMKRPIFSDTHRRRMSEAHAKRVYTKRTEEQRKRMSEWQKGRLRGPMSDAHKAAISAALKGVKKSPEHIAKARIAQIGTKKPPVTEETRRKLTAALVRRWAAIKGVSTN